MRSAPPQFDCDGALAVFCLLEPEVAAEFAELLTGAAEVGDFGDWPRSKEAYWLEAALTSLVGGRADADAYRHVLPQLAPLCRNLSAREDLWAEAWATLERLDARAAEVLEVFTVGPVAVFVHAAGTPELPTPLLAKRAPRDATRWLRAFETRDGKFDYRYELPPYAWADTVNRPPLSRPSKNAIVQGVRGAWAIKGDMGMTGLARTLSPSPTDPESTARALLSGDPRSAAHSKR
ncbi:MAG: DUF6687 family protein [Polyangiaceae bacterium]